jgi:hypothetical protein
VRHFLALEELLVCAVHFVLHALQTLF